MGDSYCAVIPFMSKEEVKDFIKLKGYAGRFMKMTDKDYYELDDVCQEKAE